MQRPARELTLQTRICPDRRDNSIAGDHLTGRRGSAIESTDQDVAVSEMVKLRGPLEIAFCPDAVFIVSLWRVRRFMPLGPAPAKVVHQLKESY